MVLDQISQTPDAADSIGLGWGVCLGGRNKEGTHVSKSLILGHAVISSSGVK